MSEPTHLDGIERLEAGAGSFYMELLARLNIVVLEQLSPNHFKALHPVPEWFTCLFALARMKKEEDEFQFVGFPWLNNFLGEAQAFWTERGTQTLKSGLWIADDASDAECHLEAFAVWLDAKPLLLIQRRNARSEWIAQLQQAQEKINYLACHDALTGLPNRTLFEDRLTHVVAHHSRLGHMLLVAFISLDRLKAINDAIGYRVGDHTLQKVAERLRGRLREIDTIARFDGNKFAIVLTHLERTEDAAKDVTDVHEILKAAIDCEGHELYIVPIIGVALYPSDGEDALTLIRNATAALNRAKAGGGDNRQFYQPSINAQARQLFALEDSLRRAISRAEFVVHYQPCIDIETDAITGMEALVRWQHPERGLLLPGEFIPVAEKSGLIVTIGEWVLRTACAQNKAWQDEGLPPVQMAVNLSARQFQQTNLVDMITALLEENRLDPAYLELEVTESLVMEDVPGALATLNRLHELGVTLSLDDFGTGYSSLSYLKQFPLDTLKIDQSFVRDVCTDAYDAAITTSIITLAHSLNLEVVAEGVETPEQCAFLQEKGCRKFQGYYFSRPVAADACAELLRKTRVRKT